MDQMARDGAVLCVAEDRQSHEPALQVLVESLHRSNPGAPVALFCPEPTAEFATWLGRFSDFTLRRDRFDTLSGWNVKPAALRRLLDEGHRRVMWFDADMVATGSLRRLLDQPDDVLVVAEEALWNDTRNDKDAQRTRGWRLPIGRTLPYAINSCIVGVTEAHRPLLDRWSELLHSPDYVAAQTQRFVDRPTHLGSDQDVLNALLCSSEFASVPLRMVERGKDIVQYFGLFGFTLVERVRAIVHGLPPILHSQGAKPWLREKRTLLDGRAGAAALLRAYNDVSPYVLYARRLNVPALSGADWTRSNSFGGAVLRTLGGGSIPLTGLPVAAAIDLARLGRTLLRRNRGLGGP